MTPWPHLAGLRGGPDGRMGVPAGARATASSSPDNALARRAEARTDVTGRGALDMGARGAEGSILHASHG